MKFRNEWSSRCVFELFLLCLMESWVVVTAHSFRFVKIVFWTKEKDQNKEQGKMKIALKRHVFAAHFSPAGRRCRRAVNLNGLREEIEWKYVISASPVRRRKVSGKNVTIVVLDRTQICSKCKYMFSMKWIKYLILWFLNSFQILEKNNFIAGYLW